mgnify:CR=1 FL=1
MRLKQMRHGAVSEVITNPTMYQIVAGGLFKMLARRLDFAPAADDVPFTAGVMANDIQSAGLPAPKWDPVLGLRALKMCRQILKRSKFLNAGEYDEHVRERRRAAFRNSIYGTMPNSTGGYEVKRSGVDR